jgi:hypothetical protein
MTHTPPIFDSARISPLTDAQLWQLMQGLHEDRVYVLSGNSYVKAWDVKATLIRVFGFGGFSTQILSEGEVFRLEVPRSNGNGKNWSVGYRISLRLIIPQLGAYYDEAAVGSNSQGSIAEAYDNAVKGAASDALKRCATLLGTQFGLSLYDNGNQQEVVKTIVAPGQEWIRGGRPAKKDPEVAALESIVHGERPDTAGGSVAHIRAEGVTPEQHQDNLNLLDKALSAKKAKDAKEAADTPMYRDTTLLAGGGSGTPVSMDLDYGGDGGKAEGMAYENM